MSKKHLILFTLLVLIFSSLFSVSLMAQMPPHPSLLEKIKSGSMTAPFLMQNVKSLRAKGIDAPWSYRDMPGGQLLNKIQETDQVRNFGPALSPTGSWKALVILVQFSDKPSQVNGTFFDNLLFSANAGSLRDYYKKVSYNNLDIITVNMPSSIGWQNAPQTYAYYCNNQNGTGTYPHNSQKLVEDIIGMVNPSIDFSQYDNDHDGYVDALFIVHSGSGAEMTGNNSDIWSHAWSTPSPISVDGVNVYHYSIEPEYWMNAGDMTIGVYAHELGHAAFGLPDLYDRDYTSSGLGSWSLMAGGSWNGVNGNSPSFPDAYCHIQMGFVTPSSVTSNVIGQLIPSIETTPKIFKIWKGGVAGSQYFLVENRQKTSYDQTLINGGLLVYHVDETITTQNDNEWYPNHTSAGHYKVALEQADGNFDLEKNNNSGDVNDPFPGNSSNTNFYNSSVPDSKDYSFSATQVGIRNIGPSSPTMTADFEITNSDTSIKIVSPNGGEKWPQGYSKQIIVDANNTGLINLEYTTDNGNTWNVIGQMNPSSPKPAAMLDAADNIRSNNQVPVYNGNVIDWIVPNSPSGQCRIRASVVSKPSLTDQSDANFSIIEVPAGQFTVQYNYNATFVTGASGNAGAIYLPDLNEFWTSRWASALLHRWSKTGTLLEQFSISGVSGVRGLTYDGNYVYASTNSTTIYIIDPKTKTLTGTIQAPMAARFVTYDPTANSGQGGFWIGNFDTDLYLISKSGTILRTIPYANLGSTSNYGAAYDGVSKGAPYIWLASQGSTQRISQISLTTGLPTGIEHDLASDIGSGMSNILSGGLFVTTGIVSGKATIGGVLQGSPDLLYGYQLCDTAPSITVTSPNGGETYKVGSNINIRWQSGLVSNVKIEFTSDNGSNWSTLSANTPAVNGSFDWTAPSNVSSQCRIKISDLANSALYDISDNVFSVALSGAVAESEPNDTKETANYVSYGDSVSASVNPIGDIDYYKFNASAGDTVEVYAANRNSSTLDGRIQIIDKDGNVLVDNDDYMDTGSSRAVCIIPSTDIYYFRYGCYNNLDYTSKKAAQKSGPQLDYQSGDYYVLLKRFHSSAPEILSFYQLYSNYNEMKFDATISSNGLATSVKIDYGTTESYGNTLNLSQINSFDRYFALPLVEGLQPNTLYHFKMTASNAKGTVCTSDLSLVTPAAPEGWTLVSTGINEYIYGISQWNKNNAIAVGNMGVTLTTVNGGDNWTSKYIASYYYPLLNVCTIDTNSAIAVGYMGYITKTTDKGSSWRVINTGRSETLYSVSFADNNNGLAVGSGVILKTTDAGENWTTISNPASLKSVTWLDANTAIAAGTNGAIIKSTDKGSTWNALTSGVSANLYSVKFFDKNTGLAAGISMILKTTDGGNTWTPKDNSASWKSVVWLDANTAIVTSNAGNISKTTDKGENWTNVNSGTNLALNSISTKDGRTLIVGNYGIVLKANETSLFKWKANITVADGNNTNSQVLSIGCSPQASQGIDTQLGEFSLPPSPPASAFDARLKLPVVPAEYSYADYRIDTLKSIDWYVSYQTGSGGNPITLSWDAASLPEGSFRLKDAITGSLVNVNMKTQNSYTLTNPELLSLKIEYRTQTTSAIQLTKGWNISSVPVVAAVMTPSSIFSAADAPVYSFNGSYQTVSTLENGKGYWVRYPSDQTVNVAGAAVGQNTIPVNAGWNLIGVYDNNITVNSITTTPSNIINSPFYGFTSGYQIPVTLESGKGYWVRASQNGTLNIGTASGQPLAKASELVIKKDWGKIIVTDRLDQRGVVYLSGEKENLSLYELPPSPPSGIFDVRYSTDRMVENISGSQVFLKISSAAYPVIIRSENFDLKIRDIIDGSLVNSILKKGTSLKIENSAIEKLLIEPVGIPLAYELKQNYPNPFNPSTTISFSLPERSRVRLIVYNQLGEMVDEIMNTQMDAGQFTIDWKPEKSSSGVYYLQMITDKFSSTKKMLYLK
ncbi:MAG: M6 family metalloprotease domain-containing protein [Bacteroidota bacterium]|nr:M6 family metalloprotease domain-containing protein [Bacteroidota bacterium]